MIELPQISHHIQKYIIAQLMYKRFARFSELRPPKVDTNLFTYHLKALMSSGLINKSAQGYTLSDEGLRYVDKVSSEKMVTRVQPKIITMLVVQNSNGDVLLQKRTKQPYIDTWTLPYGKLHVEDDSTSMAANREAKEKLGLDGQEVVHAGDVYIRVKNKKYEVISSTLAHIFKFNRDDIKTGDSLAWARPHKLRDYELAPAVAAIVARTFFNDPFFFEEFEEVWYN